MFVQYRVFSMIGNFFHEQRSSNQKLPITMEILNKRETIISLISSLKVGMVKKYFKYCSYTT
jgi:hypothetical protein